MRILLLRSHLILHLILPSKKRFFGLIEKKKKCLHPGRFIFLFFPTSRSFPSLLKSGVMLDQAQIAVLFWYEMVFVFFFF